MTLPSSFIALKGGLILPEDAIRLACDLEVNGHALSAAEGVLKVTNGSTLTTEERTSIVRWKRHLLAIAAYEAPHV